MAINVKVRYRHWLVRKVDTNGDFSLDEYSKLMEVLFDTDFFYFESDPYLKMDKNRVNDGLYLRTLYDEETGNDISGLLIDKKASVLEVLVGLSTRIEQDIMGEGENNYGKWFMEMMDNLGLLYFDDDHFLEDEIYELLERFMYRRYGSDGVGSLFPIKDPDICSENFGKLEIWNQLQYYLRENYD